MRRRGFISAAIASALVPIEVSAKHGKRLKKSDANPSDSDVVVRHEDLTPPEQKELVRAIKNDGHLPPQSESKLSSRLDEHAEPFHHGKEIIKKDVFVRYKQNIYKY